MTTPDVAGLRTMEPLRIGGATFCTRVLRSSLGGKFVYFDGSVNSAWPAAVPSRHPPPI